MTDSRTTNSRFIAAPRETVFRAFADPDALVAWLVPGEMTARLHDFDFCPGGGYVMSLFYPATDAARGKSAGREDRYTARYVEIAPPERIVQAITFDTDDPAFMGEMTMTVTLAEREGGTETTFAFDQLPSGIRAEDNDAGTRSSLEKLAAWAEARRRP